MHALSLTTIQAVRQEDKQTQHALSERVPTHRLHMHMVSKAEALAAHRGRGDRVLWTCLKQQPLESGQV